jgi:hypothetical protein
MIDRAKQELTIAFFDRFKKISEKYPEFQLMFPKTSDNLRNLLSYTYPQMLPKLRDGFFDDLHQVTYNLEAVLELPRYQTLMDNFPEIPAAIACVKLMHEIEDGATTDKVIVDIDQAISNIEGKPFYANASGGFKNMAATVHFARIFSESLRSTSTDRSWVTPAELKTMFADEITTKLYFGLLYAEVQFKNLTYQLDGKPVTLCSMIDTKAGSLLLLENKLSQFIALGEKVNKAKADIKTKNDAHEKLSPDDYFNYINISLDAADYTLSLVKIFDDRLQSDEYLAIARKSNALYKDIYTKKYTAAVTDAIDIIDNVQSLVKDRKGTFTASSIPGALNYKDASGKLFEYVDKIRPFAIFMGNVVDAGSEDDIKAALDNAILPVGSSSIKKNTLCNISVQSYLGAYYSTYNGNPTALRAWSDRFGVYGPIGLSFTPGFLSWGKAGSLSFFGSVFDLGAIIDYKLQKDPSVATSTDPAKATNSTKDYSVNLGQLFSPGLHAVYGFGGNLPLALGFGMQYGPGLSKIDDNNTVTVNNPSVRWNVFLAVDMPFFTIKNKVRTK